MSFVTPNMTLTLPSVGPSGDTGPTWAALLDAALQAVDAHTHAPGSGPLVPTAGLNINADLSFNSYNAAAVRALKFTAQGSTLADHTGIYSVNGDLYWNNASGTPVQITSGTGINISSVKGFGGDYGQAGVTAAANFTNTTHTFSFTSSSGIAALMSVGTLLIAAPSAGANPISLAAPSAATSYTLTLPAASPTANQQLISDGSGNLAWTTTTGTANQVSVAFTTGAVTLSLPQNIHTGASPTFAGLSLTTLGVSGAVSAGTLSVSGASSLQAVTATSISASGVIATSSSITAAAVAAATFSNGGAGVSFPIDDVSVVNSLISPSLKSFSTDTGLKFQYRAGAVSPGSTVNIGPSHATVNIVSASGTYLINGTGAAFPIDTNSGGTVHFGGGAGASSLSITNTGGSGINYFVVVWYV